MHFHGVLIQSRKRSPKLGVMEGRRKLQWRVLVSLVAAMAAAAVSAKEPPLALYVFGDSTVDAGTNNYINTTEDFRSDFPPYGQDFFGKPTGRFSNGRIIVDFIAEFAGLPLIPPYLQPGADHSRGANFGSGGAGVLPDTNKGLVLELAKQLAHFTEHQAAVTQQHGQAFADRFFAEAVYVLSIGSNDYLGGYYANPAQREKYTPERFVTAVVTGVVEGIQTLYKQGARKMVLLGLGPMGCLPALRAFDESGACVQPLSALATAHNDGMMQALDGLEPMLPGLTLVRAHFFGFLTERLENPSKYEYENAEKPCCGAPTTVGAVGHCVGDEGNLRPCCRLCPDANAYIWWDPYHPSEMLHRQFAETIWNGSLPYVQPMAVEALFQLQAGPACADKLDLFAGEPMQQMVFESILNS